MTFYKTFIRSVLFQIPPDFVHELITGLGGLFGRFALVRWAFKKICRYEHPSLETDVLGVHFANPVGLSGGFDKDCELFPILPSIGFGFSEVGSITARPYSGNPRPWNVRLVSDESICVNYGLKNKGVDVLAAKIARLPRFAPLVANIAKTNDLSITGADSVRDYVASFVQLQPLVDIVNLNISCPNTGDGLRFCESPPLLDDLLAGVQAAGVTKPVVLKLKPDLSEELIDNILAIAGKYDFVRGFIVSNLTLQRDDLSPENRAKIIGKSGNLSGRLVRQRANRMIEMIYRKAGQRFVIIGVGGIFSAEDAYEKICLGASLVELVTGLIFEGPLIVSRINRGVVELLRRDGFRSISEAVGSRVGVRPDSAT